MRNVIENDVPLARQRRMALASEHARLGVTGGSRAVALRASNPLPLSALGEPVRKPAQYLMLARYYGQGSTFRFMGVDPGEDLALERAQSWNKYAYTRNNPVNTRDPDGKFGLIGALVGGAVGGTLGGLLEAGIELATTHELNPQKIGAAAAGGALTGAIAGATGGASLLVQIPTGIGATVLGGMLERGVDGDDTTEILSGPEVAKDVVMGGLGGGVGAKTGELVEGAVKTTDMFKRALKSATKELKRVSQRSASRQVAARAAMKRVEQTIPNAVGKAAEVATGALVESTAATLEPIPDDRQKK